MAQKLIWNFKFARVAPFSWSALDRQEKDSIKWEARVFWPENEEILLNTIDNDLLNLNYYTHKVKDDVYYLLPQAEYNIKQRDRRLLFKPVFRQLASATGFDSKIDLNDPKTYPNSFDPSFLNNLRQQAIAQGQIIPIQKEAYVYKFPTKPRIKLELARLDVLKKIYFSACIEGRSLYLVERLSQELMGRQTFCDYLSFLKKIGSS